MARRVDHLQPQAAENEHVAVVDAQRRVRGRAQHVHDDGHGEPCRELASRREVIGMRVGVDDVADLYPVARRAREITVDLPQLGIDEHARAGLGARE